jgi:hypothetical protein
MKELIEKAELLESIMVKFAEGKMEEANDAFKSRHGYDLRDKKNNDHLVFCRWGIEDNILVLLYGEITPHDCPYSVELRYSTKDLFINCA